MHVVLSGCGVNFSVHIGALKALEDAKVKIDSITCVSGGALVGVLYSYGISLDKIFEYVCEIDFDELIRKRFILIGLWKGYFYDRKRFLNLVRDLTHGDKMTKCRIPVTVVCTDYHTGDQVNITQDMKVPIWKAIAATTSVPFYFEPVEIEGKLLRDGAIVNNIPIDTAMELWNTSDLVGVKVVTKKKIHKGPNFVTEILNLIDCFMDALNREHIEENKDKVVFIEAGSSTMNFDIPVWLRKEQYEQGYQKMKEWLERRLNEKNTV